MPTLNSSSPEAWPAVVEFRGFPTLPGAGLSGELIVWIPTGGSPAEMAHWFASALALDAVPERFAAACLGSGAPSWRPLASPAPAGVPTMAEEGSHRYRLALGGRSRSALGVQCWRCYPRDFGWQRRCGPMSLRAFIRHYAGRTPAFASELRALGPQPSALGAVRRSSA